MILSPVVNDYILFCNCEFQLFFVHWLILTFSSVILTLSGINSLQSMSMSKMILSMNHQINNAMQMGFQQQFLKQKKKYQPDAIILFVPNIC